MLISPVRPPSPRRLPVAKLYMEHEARCSEARAAWVPRAKPVRPGGCNVVSCHQRGWCGCPPPKPATRPYGWGMDGGPRDPRRPSTAPAAGRRKPRRRQIWEHISSPAGRRRKHKAKRPEWA